MISTCILTKDDATSIRLVIESVQSVSTEILIFDDHSIDETASIAVGAGATVYSLSDSIEDLGFAETANRLMSKASEEWIFIIDSDELLADPHLLPTLTRYPEKEVWALPRRKWLHYPIERTEYEAYPDWQVRFFRNKPENRFEGKMHVRLKNSNVYYAFMGPHIEHLQEQFRTPHKTIQRQALYARLAFQQGVAIKGGDVLEK